MSKISYDGVKFDSFVELVKLKRFDPGVTLHYDGTDLCGTVYIGFEDHIEKEVCEAFMELAGKTLKLF